MKKLILSLSQFEAIAKRRSVGEFSRLNVEITEAVTTDAHSRICSIHLTCNGEVFKLDGKEQHKTHYVKAPNGHSFPVSRPASFREVVKTVLKIIHGQIDYEHQLAAAYEECRLTGEPATINELRHINA